MVIPHLDAEFIRTGRLPIRFAIWGGGYGVRQGRLKSFFP